MRDIPLQQGGGTGRSTPSSTPHSRREHGKFYLTFLQTKSFYTVSTQRTRYFVGIMFVITSCNRRHCKVVFSIALQVFHLPGRGAEFTHVSFFFLFFFYYHLLIENYELNYFLFYHMKRTNLDHKNFSGSAL